MVRLLVICCALALPATASGQGAAEHLTGVVTPAVGARVDASGAFVGVAGTQGATVVREQRGATTLVTVTPEF